MGYCFDRDNEPHATADKPTVEVEVLVTRQKPGKIEIKVEETARPFWLPSKKVTIIERRPGPKGYDIVALPEDLAIENGLV